ncbi:MAG: M48 family metalloprotease [Zoogloeaceae bacterium]|jgi:predicted Zn-dependent protease|nr:M48 family metalloprotease [Zoogloeaceae bacterium]
MFRILSGVRFCCAFLLSTSCVCAPFYAARAETDDLPELGASASAGLPWSLEKRIGQDIMNQIRQTEPSYLDDPEIEDYLNRLGNRLAAVTPDAGNLHFFGVKDPSINAFAMFGGYVGVNTGLILNTQSESELAGVLAHEISHVTQRHLARGLEKQKQVSVANMLVMALAILAANSNANLAEAAMTTGTAGAIQAQLNFSRAFEREADRSGFQTLVKAGFDPRGMSAFFERLQKATRAYENNATVYLRTHPLTTERISDMQNREQGVPYRQVADSLDYHLVRARLQAQDGVPAEAVARFRAALAEKRYASLAATQYGLAVALERQKDGHGMEKALADARAAGGQSALIARLEAEARLMQGDVAGGLARYKDAINRYPAALALVSGYAEALLAAGRFKEGVAFLDARLRGAPDADARLYRLKARFHAIQGETAQQHQALAEAYAREGALDAAIEQLERAQKSPGGDFYVQSTIDARLRQLKRQKAEEKPLALP